MASANTFHYQLIIFIILIILITINGYEKTLRKIVRSQSKMVQRPFSEIEGNHVYWKNISMSKSPYHLKVHAELFPEYPQGKMLNNKQRPKMSTLLSAVDTIRSKSDTSFKMSRRENRHPNELRLTRDTFYNFTHPLSFDNVLFPLDNSLDKISNNSYSDKITVESFYKIPKTSRFFPPVEEQKPSNMQEILHVFGNESASKKTIFRTSSDIGNDKSSESNDLHIRKMPEYEVDNDKADFLIEEVTPEVIPMYYNYTVPVNPFTCVVLQPYNADIDAQDKFSKFDIEPPWIMKKQFWNKMFDSRYESLMRNNRWPPLKVILVPRTHVDSIWKQSFDQYHNNTVNKILSNLVKKLQFYKNLTFTWNEVSHLSQWWQTTTQKNRSAFRRLVRGGRLEITTGGWVEPDEATIHLFGLLHQLMEGHQWLKHHLNFVPKTAWLTNSVTHSPTMTYLLSACGISNLIFTNIHYSWEQYLAEYQYSDFIWVQNWDNDIFSKSDINDILNKIGKERYPKNSVLSHYMQFNSAGFKACGPDKDICVSDFNFVKSINNIDSYNVKQKAELLLEQYSKTGTISSHNVIIAPIGGPYHYEQQTEFDFQYNNYQKIADFVNINREIYKATIDFGTPKDYFKKILEKNRSYPSLKGDFLNFADVSSGTPAYWSGFFTTRPLLKILLRRLESTLRTTEILFSFAVSSNVFRHMNISDLFNLLMKSRETVARLHDRNVVSGTLTANVLKYVHKKILTTVKDCWYIQETSASLISIKSERNITYLQKYVYRNGEFISAFRTVTPGDQIYVFNSLSHERTEIVEFVTRNPNVRIIDHNKKDVTIQINPIWNYQSENTIKISRQFFTISFVIVIPPMTLELFKIKETYDASSSASTIYCVSCIMDDTPGNGPVFPFNIQPIEIGDIQLENYKHRLIFDEITGLLKTVFEKDTNNKKSVMIDYGAFKSNHINSGMFLFNTNSSKPLHDILSPYRRGVKTKIVLIVSGLVTTELTTIFGRLLQSSVKIFNLMNGPFSKIICVETKTDYEASPKNRELEVFLSVQTDIVNGNPPELIIDNNGFQYTPRYINISRRIESNIYPMTSLAYIQDYQNRLTLLTDHAHGVTCLQEGQIVVMLDRRVLYNDGRGTGEGLADNGATYHRHVILLENFIRSKTFHSVNRKATLQLPSLDALHLANALNYHLDIFFIDRSQTEHCYYTFLPLIKTPFPCDVFVINFRLILYKTSAEKLSINTALITLQRQSFTCEINHFQQHNCNGDYSFSIEKILRNVKAVYQTNLCGTEDGTPISKVNKGSFAPMELSTIRVYF
ncbi:PREDICTED: alpha-mannosidase 2-like [Papilio xuthus]|uniref:Alpha-mannosidase 2-like n=1 Tax=Papilio xuthus TaxID=66420 RepID=A0AAJ6ZUD9_PAPXU|nr:PREDICTED: alpha-mannosidase 2-like [Papilio xuthus]